MTLGTELDDLRRKLGEGPGRKTELYPEVLVQRRKGRNRGGSAVSSCGVSSGGLAKDEFGSLVKNNVFENPSPASFLTR